MPSLYLVKNFVGIKLGTGGLVRAYGGAASDCLRTCLIKSKVLIFNVRMGSKYHMIFWVSCTTRSTMFNSYFVLLMQLQSLLLQLQSFQVEDINQDYDTGKGDTTMVTFKVNYDQVQGLEDAVKSNCSHHVVFYKH
ncbi:unnamed protein product [Rhodiola kirilowii]